MAILYFIGSIILIIVGVLLAIKILGWIIEGINFIINLIDLIIKLIKGLSVTALIGIVVMIGFILYMIFSGKY